MSFDSLPIQTKISLMSVVVSLATVSLLGTLPVQAATLSWQTIKTSHPSLFNANSRFATASNTLNVTNGGTVGLSFGSINNINTASFTRVQGISSQFVNNSPRIDSTYNGTLSDTSPSLNIQQNATSVGNAVYAGFKFNTTGGVSGLTFTLFDIDNSSNTIVSNNWQDRVIVRGLLNGVAVLPTTVTAISPYSIGTGNVGINYAGATVAGATVLDGTKSVNDSTSNNGNVTVIFNFNTKIDQLYIDFTQASGAFSNPATANPGSHGIGIGDMTFAVPEPFTLLGSGAAIGFGAIFKRRLAKARSQKKA